MSNNHTATDRWLIKSALTPAAITAAGVNGSIIDTLGFTRALFIFNSAPSGTGTTSDCKLQEGAAANLSDAADVTNATFTQVTTVTGHKVECMNVDLSKRKRYLRLVQTGAGGSAAGAFSGEVILYNGEGMPPTQDVTPVSV